MNEAKAFDTQRQSHFRFSWEYNKRAKWVHCTDKKLKFLTATFYNSVVPSAVAMRHKSPLTHFIFHRWFIFMSHSWNAFLLQHAFYFPYHRDERNIVWITTCWNANHFVFVEWNAEKSYHKYFLSWCLWSAFGRVLIVHTPGNKWQLWV